jgi:hypothetical protein
VTDLASAAAHLRAVVLHLHHLVAHVAHLRQNHRDLPQDAEHVAPYPRPAVRDAHPRHEADLPQQGDQVEGGTSRCPLLLETVGGSPGIFRRLVPRQSNRAHQHPGCHDHGHELRCAVAVVLPRCVRGLQVLLGSDDADALRPLVPTPMALALISRSVSFYRVPAGHDREPIPLGPDAEILAHPQSHRSEESEVHGSRFTVAAPALQADRNYQNGLWHMTPFDLDLPKQHESPMPPCNLEFTVQ